MKTRVYTIVILVLLAVSVGLSIRDYILCQRGGGCYRLTHDQLKAAIVQAVDETLRYCEEQK